MTDHTIPMLASPHKPPKPAHEREWRAPPHMGDHPPPPERNGRAKGTVATIVGVVVALAAMAAIWNQHDDEMNRQYNAKFDAIALHLSKIDSSVAADTQANIDELHYLDQINGKLDDVLARQLEVKEALKHRGEGQ